MPLQQIISEMLVESGMLMRRERSFDGVEFESRAVEIDLTHPDAVSAIFRQINAFDKLKTGRRSTARSDHVQRWEDRKGFVYRTARHQGHDLFVDPVEPCRLNAVVAAGKRDRGRGNCVGQAW